MQQQKPVATQPGTAPADSTPSEVQLCPPPKKLERRRPWHPPRRLPVHWPKELPIDGVLAQRLRQVLADGRRQPHWTTDDAAEDVALSASEAAHGLRLRLDPSSDLPPEGYHLRLDHLGGHLEAASEAGLFYGVATLGQWLRLHAGSDAKTDAEAIEGGSVPGVAIEDWPDFPRRGVMLDISRNKVPRLDTLMDLIDLLADCKINHLQLYIEHTFAYRGHQSVWREASPMTADDIRQIDTYCRQRHIELAANQNSFGHFHRWLIHPEYRPLAECPEGIEHPFSDQREPFSLCPVDDRTFTLLEDLYDQLLPNFTSNLVNVGLDETMDLGRGRSAEACRQRGRGAVYLDYLRRVHGLLAERGRRMMYWGDIVLDHPQLIPRLPGDAIILAWGYEANFPFDAKARQFSASGLEFWLCPGTSTWSSFAGRGDNALLNLANAAVAGQRHGSSGYLITEWGDHGHLQTWPTAYLGFLAGAAMAWNVDCAKDPLGLPVADWLDAYAFRDGPPGLGRVAVDLANAYSKTNAPPPGGPKINGSALFFQLIFAHKPAAERRGLGMTPGHLLATRRYLATALRGLPDDSSLEVRELRWLGDILDLACRLALARFEAGLDAPVSDLPGPLRHQLDDELAQLIQRRHDLWLARHRPGGWALSAEKLERLRRLLVPPS